EEQPAEETEEQPAEETEEQPEEETEEQPAEETEEQPAEETEEQPEEETEEQPEEGTEEQPEEEAAVEALTVSNLTASATDVFEGERIEFTFETTGAERVEYAVYDGESHRVAEGELEGTSFSWTPDAAGSYIAAVSAFRGDESVTVSVAVTVKADHSDVNVTYSVADEDGKAIEGYGEAAFSRGDYALESEAPVSVDGYIYQGATLNGTKLSRLWYDEDDRAWKYTDENEDGILAEDAAVVLSFERIVYDITVTFSAIDSEGNGVGGLVDVALARGEYDLTVDGPAPVNSEKNYKYVNTTLNDAVVTKLAYSDEALAWQADMGGETVILTEDAALIAHYEEQFKERVYRYSDSNISAVVTLSDKRAVPDDAELVVTPITGGSSYDAYMTALNGSTEQEYNGENTLLYDFAFMVKELDPETGEPTGKTVEYTPEPNSMRVSVTFKKNQISDGLNAEEAADVGVHHMPLKDSVLEDVDATVEANVSTSDIAAVETLAGFVNLNGSTDSVSFRTDSFSVFAFTVDFHYEGVDYSIPGMSQILLSTLIEKLHIINGEAPLDVQDVASVEFSDEHLVTVQEVSGLITYNEEENVDVGEKDFLLSSQQPFTSEETLTITLIDGTVITVGVTDEQEPATSTELVDYLTNATIVAPTNEEGKYVVLPNT
ncbi:MAG: hypothetical protein IJH03_05275, partial [Clostridia bacterium]|nr:hypothetical protein [Clostridia bacterium]